MTTRIEKTFARLKAERRGGLVTFIMAGDPDLDSSFAILERLPAAGADIIELGMAFTDPMADGPAIQEAGNRALAAGATLRKTLDMVARFRERDSVTPIVLMGYYNPIYSLGVDHFLARAKAAGVDGLIVVDLPPEEDEELCLPAQAAGIDFVRLATPTTDDRRLPTVLRNTGGFVYYVSVAGITGAQRGAQGTIDSAVKRIQAARDLPVVVGFGIKNAADVREITSIADAAVVGSALVSAIKQSLDGSGRATPETVDSVIALVQALAQGKAEKVA